MLDSAAEMTLFIDLLPGVAAEDVRQQQAAYIHNTATEGKIHIETTCSLTSQLFKVVLCHVEI